MQRKQGRTTIVGGLGTVQAGRVQLASGLRPACTGPGHKLRQGLGQRVDGLGTVQDAVFFG